MDAGLRRRGGSGGSAPPNAGLAGGGGGGAHDHERAAAPAGPVADCSTLPGRPDQPFHHRLCLKHSHAGLAGELLLLAMHATFARRGSAADDPLLGLWRAATISVLLFKIAWRFLAPESHAAWREALVFVLRLASMGLGVGMRHVWRLVNEGGAGDAASAAAATAAGGGAAVATAHAVRLLFASCAVTLAMAHTTLRMRFIASLLSQAGLVMTLMPYTREGCSGAFMSQPVMTRATHSVFTLLSWVGTPLPLPLAPLATPDAAAECAAVISWAQLGLGCLLPLLHEALTTAAAFHGHQRQRAAAGLPPERGLHALLYGGVYELCRENELGAAIPLPLLAWLLLAVTWDWSAFFCARAAEAAAAAAAAVAAAAA